MLVLSSNLNIITQSVDLTDDDVPLTVSVRALRTREGCSPADYRPTSASSVTSEANPDVPSDHLESDADGGRWTDVSLLDLDIDMADLEMPPATTMRDIEVMADIQLPPPPPIYYRLTADTRDTAVQCDDVEEPPELLPHPYPSATSPATLPP